jgi:hypothetical protein
MVIAELVLLDQFRFLRGRKRQLPQAPTVDTALVDSIACVGAFLPGEHHCPGVEREIETPEHAALQFAHHLASLSCFQVQKAEIPPGFEPTVDVIGVVVVGLQVRALNEDDSLEIKVRSARAG